MDYVLHPWQFLLIGLAGWINRNQQETIEDLRTENQILRDVVGKKRILLNDDQRRRLAVNGKVLGLPRRSPASRPARTVLGFGKSLATSPIRRMDETPPTSLWTAIPSSRHCVSFSKPVPR